MRYIVLVILTFICSTSKAQLGATDREFIDIMFKYNYQNIERVELDDIYCIQYTDPAYPEVVLFIAMFDYKDHICFSVNQIFKLQYLEKMIAILADSFVSQGNSKWLDTKLNTIYEIQIGKDSFAVSRHKM